MEIKLRGRTINVRKWKVKDRTNYINAQDPILKRQALVYNCLDDPNTPLDIEEYNYVLLYLRSISVSDIIKYKIKCPECGNEFNANINLSDVLNINFDSYKPIIVDDISIDLFNVQNKQAYETRINSVQIYILSI